jgi:hypothetical protein
VIRHLLCKFKLLDGINGMRSSDLFAQAANGIEIKPVKAECSNGRWMSRERILEDIEVG